jgi:TolB-like protein
MLRVDLRNAIACAVLVTACSVSAQSDPASIVVVPFAALEDAPPMLAERMRKELAASLDLDPCVAARADREDSELPPEYILEGTVYAEADRAFVALRLVRAATAERVWFENYDYRGIGADMMARDILSYVKREARARCTGDNVPNERSR